MFRVYTQRSGAMGLPARRPSIWKRCRPTWKRCRPTVDCRGSGQELQESLDDSMASRVYGRELEASGLSQKRATTRLLSITPSFPPDTEIFTGPRTCDSAPVDLRNQLMRPRPRPPKAKERGPDEQSVHTRRMSEKCQKSRSLTRFGCGLRPS
jgi:hypothetical protein